jgi:hypothetical protein
LGNCTALVNDIHAIVILRNHRSASLVLAGGEEVWGGLVGVGDGVDWAGDTCEEVAIGEVDVGEELIGDEWIGDLGDPSVGGAVLVGGGSF